jgi:hypothetical protein
MVAMFGNERYYRCKKIKPRHSISRVCHQVWDYQYINGIWCKEETYKYYFIIFIYDNCQLLVDYHLLHDSQPTYKSHNLSTRCVRNRLVASLSTSCNNAIILPSCCKFVTHNLLTNCWIAGRQQVVRTTCSKSVELNNLVASCQQAGNKQCEHILLTSCRNSIAASLLQVC